MPWVVENNAMDAYWQVFLFFGAVIQIIDDWTDLE